jgi:prepilin-type N-terminal cleavage/methylation domain-containing protein
VILPGRRKRARRAFTLIELLLVLAVVLAFLSMSWPAMRAALSKGRLREAGRQVRIELAKTRLNAVESGAARQFRFQPGGRCFEVGPAAYGDGADAAAPSRLLAATTNARAPGRPLTSAAVRDELPEGVCFSWPDSNGAPPLEPRSPEGLDDDHWSPPIVFHPNGTTSNAQIRLRGQRGLYVDVTLRGLTGTVEVSELQRDEAPR